MIVGHSQRIYLCSYPTSMKKSFEGLSALVEEFFPGELTSGSCFLFLNRRKDCIKILYWDGDGFAIWYKRLERGSFRGKSHGEISRRDLLLLLEGVVPKRIDNRFSL